MHWAWTRCPAHSFPEVPAILRLQKVALVVTAVVLVGLAPCTRPAPPAGDAAAGERAYARCIGCHSPEWHRAGPRHCGLLGRVSGTASGYDYSEAMRQAAIPWDAASLDRFLAAPMTVVPGTSMGFAGIADAAERRDLIAWLATLVVPSKHCPGAQEEE